MNNDVLLALLALDSYNRGPESALSGLSAAPGTQLGNLTILEVTVTVHLIIKTAQTLTNKSLDSQLTSTYVLVACGDEQVLARTAL
jgi:hypothetical protein